MMLVKVLLEVNGKRVQVGTIQPNQRGEILRWMRANNFRVDGVEHEIDSHHLELNIPPEGRVSGIDLVITMKVREA